MKAPWIIGIVGPPCSGKSTVSETLQEYGGLWLNADLIAKEQLLEPDVKAEIQAAFGVGVIDSSGNVSRPELAKLVFGHDEESASRLETLEAILHPRTRALIHERLSEARERKRPIVILDIPLLFEVGWESECDEVWCLRVSPEKHRQLLAARGWDASELKRRQANQLAPEIKQQRATLVIDNDGTPEDLRQTVKNLIESQLS